MEKLKDYTFLILGGCGFIGRNLIHHLVENKYGKEIIVVDKVIPELAWLSEQHKKSFKKVKFIQANLIKTQSVIKIFEGIPSSTFVINSAGETRSGQHQKIYEEGIYNLSLNCSKEAEKNNIFFYIELSSAELLSNEKSLSSSLEKLSAESFSSGIHDNWQQMMIQKLRVEREVKGQKNLSTIFLRLPVVYGDGDIRGLTPFLIFAGTSKSLGEPLQLLWSSNHKYNTVHVEDVARAICLLCYNHLDNSIQATKKNNREEQEEEEEEDDNIYYLSDHTDTSQGLIGEFISKIFNIECQFMGSISSNLAKLNKEDVALELMEKHLPPWSEACSRDSIFSTPLYPFITEEIFYSRPVSIKGNKIEKKFNFQYKHPVLTSDHVRSLLQYHLNLHLFPPSLLE